MLNLLNNSLLIQNLFTNFAYNGMKLDNEVSGNGNSYTTLFRELDVRLGRWWAVDPKSEQMPWQSSYNSMDNNPIWHNDPLGDDIEFGSKEAKEIHNKKYTPQYKKNIFGKIKQVSEVYNEQYVKTFDQINNDHSVLFFVHEKGNSTNIEGYGTIIPDKNKTKKGQDLFHIIWSEPGEAHGGTGEHVLLEEVYHAKQILDSKEFNTTRNMPDFTAEMEVEAKEFAGSVGVKHRSNYLAPGGGGYSYPTEMGIINNTNSDNRGIDKVSFLTIPTQITISRNIQTLEGLINDFKESEHLPIYPSLKK